jgi:alpha-ribazole phosphatase
MGAYYAQKWCGENFKMGINSKKANELTIYLVRHTLTEVPSGICYGQSDVELAHSGESLTQEWAPIFNQLPLSAPVRIFSSPLKRCVQMAQAYQNHLQIQNSICLDSRLQEVNFGEWELKSWNELQGPLVEAWMSDFVNVSPPNGESYLKLSQRVLEFFNTQIPRTSPHIPVVVFSHGGPIRSLLAFFKQVSLQDSFEISVELGSVHTLNLP